MIKILIKNNLQEERSKTRFLDAASRDIKNFIVDQLTNFPDTYFKKSDVHEFKITDLPSIKDNEKLSNLKNLKLKILKKDQEQDVDIPKATYHPPDVYVSIIISFKKNITNLNDLDKKYFKFFHETIAKMAYHELVHHLQFEHYRQDYSSDRGAFSTVTTPMTTYVVDTTGATEKEIKEYDYYSSPDEIEAYVRDTYYSARKKRVLFSKLLASRIRYEKEKTFKSLRGKYLYYALIYNMLLYAIERYPNVNNEKNNETLKKYKEFLDKNKELGMEKQITTESLTSNFKNWMKEDLITESSVGQLIAAHGVPKTFAKHVKTKCSNGNSDFILKVFMKNYKNMIETMTSESASERDKMLSDNYIMEFDRFMGHAGKTLDEYLKKYKGKKYREEILELCEAGWPKFLKKMREYKKSLDESLNEVRLNKTWKKRIKQRAKRHDRDVSSEDKKWAKNRLKELNKKYPELEEAYLNEIEAAMEAAKASNVYLEKLRTLRKQKLEAKKNKLDPAFPVKPHNRIKSSSKKPTHVGDINPSGGTGAAPVLEIDEKNLNNEENINE